jgi:hypothetical protein
MKPLCIFVFCLLVPGGALAQDTGPSPEGSAPEAAAAATADAGVGPVDAAGLTIAQFHWDRRPLVIFADGPTDPLFRRQMDWVMRDLEAFAERDVVVIVDTDPAARNPVRQQLRPRGFSLVLMDKDGEVKMRKPQPWTVREITRAIDRFPLRRQEMLERRPSGR